MLKEIHLVNVYDHSAYLQMNTGVAQELPCVAFLSNIVNRLSIQLKTTHSSNIFIRMILIIYYIFHTLFFKISQTITEKHIIFFFF